jgi:hypothetical protein
MSPVNYRRPLVRARKNELMKLEALQYWGSECKPTKKLIWTVTHELANGYLMTMETPAYTALLSSDCANSLYKSETTGFHLPVILPAVPDLVAGAGHRPDRPGAGLIPGLDQYAPAHTAHDKSHRLNVAARSLLDSRLTVPTIHRLGKLERTLHARPWLLSRNPGRTGVLRYSPLIICQQDSAPVSYRPPPRPAAHRLSRLEPTLNAGAGLILSLN